MAALKKEKPSPADNAKQTENIKTCKKSYFPSQHRHYSGRILSSQSRYQKSEPDGENKPSNINETQHCRNQKNTVPKNDNKQRHKKPQTNPIRIYDKINTSYTPFTLLVHITIIFQHLYTLFITPSTSLPSTRLTSFTQLVYITTTCFHIATLLANLFKKSHVEKVFVLYGTWVIWSGWSMCLWLITPDNRLDPLLTPSIAQGHYHIIGNDSVLSYKLKWSNLQENKPIIVNIAPFLMHGRWISTTLPILSFFLLLTIRRNHWGLITWEHLAFLDFTKSTVYYRTWCVAGAGAGWIILWEAIKLWFHVPFAYIDNIDEAIMVYHTDLFRFPGLFNFLFFSFISGMFKICWWSFWTFQYQGIVWKKELKEGLVVWSSDGLIRIGDVCSIRYQYNQFKNS